MSLNVCFIVLGHIWRRKLLSRAGVVTHGMNFYAYTLLSSNSVTNEPNIVETCADLCRLMELLIKERKNNTFCEVSIVNIEIMIHIIRAMQIVAASCLHSLPSGLDSRLLDGVSE